LFIGIGHIVYRYGGILFIGIGGILFRGMGHIVYRYRGLLFIGMAAYCL
jgi:hypothetical protein